MGVRYRAATFTDGGERINEDRSILLKKPGRDMVFLLAVADGVGGLDAGEVASEYMKRSLENWFREQAQILPVHNYRQLAREMRLQIANIHMTLCTLSEMRNIKLGTTLSMALITDERYVIAQVGDSRCYLMDQDGIQQITKDQTVAQKAEDQGIVLSEIAKKKQNHILIQCVGQGKMEPVFYTGELERDYALLLCSDGLSNRITIEEIQEELSNDKPEKEKLMNLSDVARSRGEKDNITAVLITRETWKEEDDAENGGCAPWKI